MDKANIRTQQYTKLNTRAKEIQQVNPGGPDNSQSILKDVVFSLTYLSLVSILWDIGKQCKPRSDAAKAASDQVLNCMLTEVHFKLWMKLKNITQQPYNLKLTRPIDKDWKKRNGINGLTMTSTCQCLPTFCTLTYYRHDTPRVIHLPLNT